MNAKPPDGAKFAPERVEPLTPEQEREFRLTWGDPRNRIGVALETLIEGLFATLDAERARAERSEAVVAQNNVALAKMECRAIEAEDALAAVWKWIELCERHEGTISHALLEFNAMSEARRLRAKADAR